MTRGTNTVCTSWTKEDLFSRLIVGWAFANTLETKLVLDALGMARAHRKPDAVNGLLHHSDCGSQYASIEYRKALNELKATCSMSRKGNCWDNAVMESFFSTSCDTRGT